MPYAKNKDAGQPAHPYSLIGIFVIRCLDRIITLFSVAEISSLLLVSVAEQTCLRLTWSKPWRGERGGSVVECRTPEREVRGSRPTAAVLCPWARHFTPRKYWLITQEAMAPSRHDWKIVDWDVKPQHNQPTKPWRQVFMWHCSYLNRN